MAIQKKHGKGRLDKWYKLAKEKGYRARAAFKLIQLNKKYGFLESSKVVLDLCAAPGSWMQVCAETMPTSSLIVGVDLAPIKPISRCISFQSDITTEKCRATIRQHLKTWKADTVLHDGAPNVGTAWVQDAYSQAELVLHSLKLATEFLMAGGTFVTKVFRSKDYNSLLWVFNQLFAKVEATKPPSSRNVSAEIFCVCKGFKAPKRIDPRLLDPRSVFQDLQDPTPNNEAKVYKPEVKKRKREGYEDGDYLQFKEVPATEFIQTTDPIAVLGSVNRLSFAQPPNGEVALATLDKLPETTPEIRDCCADLKVLGKKDFKLLLKWRLRVRDILGFPSKKTAKADEGEEVAEVEPMDEELRIQEELQRLKEKETGKKKRERRRDNEKKQRDIVRMQMNMTAPMDIGMEQDGPSGAGSMFRLKAIDKTDALARIAKGKMVISSAKEDKKEQTTSVAADGTVPSAETDGESGEEEEALEEELDAMYQQYTERRAAVDAKYRAKRARKEHDDDEWEGVSADEQAESGDDDDLLEEESGDSDEEDGAVAKPLIQDLDGAPDGGASALSKRARKFFSQDIFKHIPGLLDEPEEEEDEAEESRRPEPKAPVASDKPGEQGEDIASDDGIPTVAEQKRSRNAAAKSVPTAESNNFVVVKAKAKDEGDDDDDDDDWEEHHEMQKDGEPNIDIITAEAMTLAHQLATREKTRQDVVDEAFNRHAFKDKMGLPDWFLDDEGRHDRPQKPISKAAAQAIKDKLRAYNARPIKKVREAKARKQFKAAQRLEKVRKKGELLMAEEGLTEREKADQMTRMMGRYRAAKKGVRRPVTVVKATGVNKGKGRPRGVKGRYRMVDPRMKKELRANKRLTARKKR